MTAAGKQIAIITTCEDDWGGSEELWSRAIPYLQLAGYGIVVLKRNLNKQHRAYVALADKGVWLEELEPGNRRMNAGKETSFPEKAVNRLFSASFRLYRSVYRHIRMFGEGNSASIRLSYTDYLIEAKLRKIRPQLVVLAQGINFDGLNIAHSCLRLGFNYVIITQKAVDFFWPHYTERTLMRELYLKASRAYFVSKHNQQLTEEQFGKHFPNAEVVFNTIKVARQKVPMPGTEKGFRLACIGRYFLLDKGQDILIRILSKPKWKARPLIISFIGKGGDRLGLMELAGLLGVENVQFHNYSEDIEEIWKTHHALILPSRSEGMPLVLLEAMACGRTAIVTNAGGNGELINDGVNGFVGEANEADFDAAMERAWNERYRWEIMGEAALRFIEDNIPLQPEKYFAETILKQIALKAVPQL